MASHNELGKKGEQLAMEYLLKKGYKIVATNWRYQKAEIDIIAQKGEILAIVEVKTRSSNTITAPEDAVNKRKIDLLVAAADQYIIKNNLDVEARFDIITVLKKRKSYIISYITDAFLFF